MLDKRAMRDCKRPKPFDKAQMEHIGRDMKAQVHLYKSIAHCTLRRPKNISE